MFEVGFTELVLLMVIGLLVLGPERLPKVAGQLGKWAGRARRTLADLRHQLEREVELDKAAQAPRPKLRVVPTRDPSTSRSATGTSDDPPSIR